MQAELEQIIRRSPPDTAVFIPAAGELHTDHRTLRRLALAALAAAGRSDLLVLESPEYNAYVSMTYDPRQAIRHIFSSIPILGRLTPREPRKARAAFACGGASMILAPDAKRLARKEQMLRAYTSEDGDLLVSLFGHPDLYRQIADPEQAQRDSPRGYVQFGFRRVGASVIGLWLTVYAGVFAASAGLVRAIFRLPLPSGAISVAVSVLAAGLAAVAIMRCRSMDRRLFYAFATLGLLIAAWR